MDELDSWDTCGEWETIRTKRILNRNPDEGRRRGRARKRWLDDVRALLGIRRWRTRVGSRRHRRTVISEANALSGVQSQE